MAERGSRVDIDMAELEKLCALQATDAEIAGWFGVSTRMIERRRLETEFAEVMIRGKAKGRISIRRHQMRLLEAGSGTMAMWLGRHVLGQVDDSAHATVQIAVFAGGGAADAEQPVIDIAMSRSDS